jgi:hypothetical protein
MLNEMNDINHEMGFVAYMNKAMRSTVQTIEVGQSVQAARREMIHDDVVDRTSIQGEGKMLMWLAWL